MSKEAPEFKQLTTGEKSVVWIFLAIVFGSMLFGVYICNGCIKSHHAAEIKEQDIRLDVCKRQTRGQILTSPECDNYLECTYIPNADIDTCADSTLKRR